MNRSIRRLFVSLLVHSSCVLFAACSTGDPVPQNDGGCTDDWIETFLVDLPTRVGDVSCMGADLNSQSAASSCVTDVPLVGRTVDHQSSNPLGNVAVSFFLGDDIDASVDESVTSNGSGDLPLGAFPVCSPIAYRATGDSASTLPTLGQHKIYPPGASVEADFRSIAQGTIALVTLGFGITSQSGMGMVFGKAIACNNDDALEGVQIIIRDDACKIPTGSESFIGYTSNKLPDPSLRTTSADGFFFATNVPPGTWTLEMVEASADGHRLIGSAPVVVKADSVSLVDVRVGRDDGVVMPPECLSCP
jgi:hypothetical protein